MPSPVNCTVNLKATTSKKGGQEGTHAHMHTHTPPTTTAPKNKKCLFPAPPQPFWVLHGSKSPHSTTKTQPGDGFGTPNPAQRSSLLHSPFQPDLRLRLKVEALKHPFTSLSQVTDFLLHLISGRQQMLFPQQKPHSTCYSRLETTLSFLPSSRPR